MSAIPVEATEPDPASTSLPNEETVNKPTGDPSAPTDTVLEDAKVEATPANGSAIEEESGKTGENGAVTEGKDGEKKERVPRQRTYSNGMLKTSAHEREGKNNSKYDPSVLPETDDHKKIRAQVEFYFSDSNLPTDKFLWDLTDGASNHPVNLDRIMSFGRMKRFQPKSAVVAALRESNFLVITGAEDQEMVNRKYPYDPTTPASKIEPRSVYVKGFGDEEPSSQFDIEAFFARFGSTNSVRLRRTPEKLFKGSVFVEFQDEETAQKFLEMDPKPLWQDKHVLEIKSKKDYCELKQQEIKDGKIEPMEQRNHRGGRGGRGRGGRGDNRGHRGGGRGRGDSRGGDRGGENGDRDPDDWKKRREDDRASGFKDNRKGGRGDKDRRDRGGRGGRRDDRGPRNNDRNKEREDKDVKAEPKTDDAKAAVKEEPSSNGNKRAREDEGADGNDKPAKKADTKTEVEA